MSKKAKTEKSKRVKGAGPGYPSMRRVQVISKPVDVKEANIAFGMNQALKDRTVSHSPQSLASRRGGNVDPEEISKDTLLPS